jgi:sulfide:quinone oxidoreductase
VSLPGLDGPALPGLPADGDGFIPVDGYGRVLGWSGVYAAGDGTSFPIKQGGLATQQADAVAEAIAAEAGAPVEPEPFRPVLRGMLLTGGDDRWLRNPVAGGDGEGQVSGQSLWWPPTKIAGRYIAAYLFGRDEAEAVARQGHLEVEIPLEARAPATS